ncbi:ATP-binding protein [Lactiplantibacillus plantarum]|uniref:ATP-binding protein n=1 Tax=Lactiplantibacillus plantarum TaxID=1590 RepID=UPI00203B9F9F|nr:ATP-binding protein [Lactiplantibacillus plantarum]MCM2586618.1 ATP-binding protein [Lactiplantibacillus plantarum]MCM2597674.1 ATP-binding protein [Lactiplantibacillus plantarum]MCM2600872.1 ATP-binding protein [Lactiplantibacillus plantarum]MCM2608176.1 ATP-binding protein [Lactiplantibacillus plantarum]MCM2612711.1 ATP-binding protein [Lactiplantibacillus plantarum]
MALSYQALLTAVPVVLKAGNVPNIVGEAGIGKSALVAEVAKRMGAQLYTTVVSLSEKGDLAIPVPPLTSDSFIQTKRYGQLADVQFGYAHTLIEIIQYAEQHPQQPILWFLDEFNRGTQAVQSELMNLVLQRTINTLKLPEQVQLITAENPDASMTGFESSTYGVTAGDAAIKDRTVRLVMRADAADWLAWAKQVDERMNRPNIHPLVQQFISEDVTRLNQADVQADLTATPRAWTRVSANLYEIEKLPVHQQTAVALDIFQGDVGTELGLVFEQFLEQQAIHLTPAMIYDSQPVGAVVPAPILKQFTAMNEIQKRTVLASCLALTTTYPLTDDQHAGRFMQLLQTLSQDGQFALVQQIGHERDLLKQLYTANVAKQSPYVTALYQYLQQVASWSNQ